MLKNKIFTTSVFFSIIIHLVVAIYLNQENKNKEIYVVNLSEFRELSFIPPEKSNQNKFNKKIENFKKKKDQPIIEKKLLKKEEIIPLKKIKVKQDIIKKKEVNSPQPENQIQKNEKQQKTTEKSNKSQSIIDKGQSEKKIIKNQSVKNKESVIFDKLLSDYLSSVSFEINKKASKAYPIQSIKRREQGTINSLLVIDKDGNLLDLKVLDKAPKRLHKATLKTLRVFNFPKPPPEIIGSDGKLKIKIPVNFILK